jgi:spore maturation protein CgeB
MPFPESGLMAVWEKNRAVLAAVQPGVLAQLDAARPLLIETSPQGHPVLRVGGVTLHSPADPIREARGWLNHARGQLADDPGEVIVFGFGLGYHLEALAGALEPDRPIHVIEPDPAVIRTALGTRDLRGLLSRTIIHLDPAEIGPPAALLIHQPTARLYPRIKQSLTDRLSATPGPGGSGPLRILVVLPVWGGSLPIGRWVAAELIRAGHQVETIDASQADYFHDFIKRSPLDESLTDPAAAALIDFFAEFSVMRCREFSPDLVLAMAQAPLSPRALRRLRDLGFTTAMWFVENHRAMPYYAQVAAAYDHFFVIQKEPFLSHLRAMGVRAHYLPLAAAPGVHCPRRLTPEQIETYGADVAFLGEGYPNRRRFFAGLLDYDLKIWGTGWDLNSPLGERVQRGGARIGTDEVVNIYNATRINLNLHSSVAAEGVETGGDFVNPRTFEIAACGAFQLVDDRTLLAEFFEPGREVEVFTGLDDLKAKLDYYLAHPEAARAMADAARGRVLSEHTYGHRLARLLETVFPERVPAAGEARKADDTTAWLQGAGFDPDREPDLRAVAETIRAGQGPLNEIETYLLLLAELGADRRG